MNTCVFSTSSANECKLEQPLVFTYSIGNRSTNMGANPLKITCWVQVASFYRFLPIILVILVEALKFKADSMYFMYLSEKVDNPLLLQTDTRRIR